MNTNLFYAPQTLFEALTLLDTYQQRAVVVNGGTDIVEKIGKGSVEAEALIYIQNISELKEVKEQDGYVCIGGAATYSSVLTSPLCKQFSGLYQAIQEIGSPPIRAVGTPAGNIGTAVPAADCNVALIALDARIILSKLGGERVVEAKDMFVSYCRTQLEPGELIKEIRIPVTGANTASSFVKLAKRKAQDIAQVSAAVRLTVEGGVCRDAIIALGAVSSTSIRAYSLENNIVGKEIDAVLPEIKQFSPTEVRLRNPRNRPYKEAVLGIVVERAIKMAYAEVMGRKN